MKLSSTSGITWTDIEDPKREDIEALGAQYPFHPLNLDDCLSKRNLPKVDDYEDHMYVLLQFPVMDEKKGLLKPCQVSMFLGRDYFVTIHEEGLPSLSALFTSCQSDEKTRSEVMRSSADIFYRVIDALVNGIFPLLKRVRTDLEDIEDKVFDPRVSVAIELMRQRRVIAELRHEVAPLRRLLLDMTVDAQRFAKQDLTKYFGDVRDHIEKAWAVLEEAKETIEIYKDTDYVLSSELTNKVLSILTIIFTLTIPATVVGSIYGTNIPLPGGIEAGPLTFLGTFTSFYVLMGIAFIPAIAMLLYFRKRGWV